MSNLFLVDAWLNCARSLLKGSVVTYEYDKDFMSNADAVNAFETLWTGLVWERRSDAPRYEYWTNVLERAYTYGTGNGIRTYEARPSNAIIDFIKLDLSERLGFLYEGCFLNGYDSTKQKQDWLGWHEDDDLGINHDRPIAIVTLYGKESAALRKIAFREKLGIDATTGKMTYGPVEEVFLENGSLMLMPAGFQSKYQHSIPKMANAWDSRISLTYRSLI